MATKYLMGLTSPTSASDDEAFNQWYEEVHIPEVTSLPSFKSAKLFKLSSGQLADDVPIPKLAQTYLALYEVTDTAAAAEELAGGLEGFQMTELLDADKTLVTFFEETFSYP